MKSCETPPLSQRYYQIQISAKLIGPTDSCKISGFGFQKKISDYVLAEGSKSRKKAFAFSIAGNSFDHDSTVQICVIFIRFAFDMLSPHMIPASRFLIIVGCRMIIYDHMQNHHYHFSHDRDDHQGFGKGEHIEVSD